MGLGRWLLLSHVLVVAAAVGLLLASGLFDRDLQWQTRHALHGQAQAWALDLADEVARGTPLARAAAAAKPRLDAAREHTLVGLQVVDAHGRVVASAGRARDADLADSPEVRAALAGQIGEHARARDPSRMRDDIPLDGPSRFGRVRLFVAVPIVVEGKVVGAVVASRTARAQVQALISMGSPLLLRLALIAGFAALVALGAAYYGSRSLRRVSQAAGSLASGGAADTSPNARALRGSHITEVARVAEALHRMGARLRERTDCAEAFAGNAAHELRTPIATLLGTLELMRDDPAMPSEQRERFLDNGIAELQRLDALVGGLLQLGRAPQLLVREEVDLDALLRSFGRVHGIEPEGHAGTVHGSKAALGVVLGNLLDNAAHHGGEDIRLVASRREGRVLVSVIDDGDGIPAEVAARMFERFFTTDRDAGVGLGLAVVQSLVEAHGGEVELESEPGRTRIGFWLPTER